MTTKDDITKKERKAETSLSIFPFFRIMGTSLPLRTFHPQGQVNGDVCDDSTLPSKRANQRRTKFGFREREESRYRKRAGATDLERSTLQSTAMYMARYDGRSQSPDIECDAVRLFISNPSAR